MLSPNSAPDVGAAADAGDVVASSGSEETGDVVASSGSDETGDVASSGSEEAGDVASSGSDESAFARLNLHPGLLQALADAGYTAPTPVQEQTIPPLLDGRDVVGQAQTGTGKTAAFGLPLLQRLDPTDSSVQALVLAPTRELALQVTDALNSYATHIGRVRIATVYGGQPIQRQIEVLRRGVQVVVGTPGRLIDCLERGVLDLRGVRMLVLDEADEMLRMGFLEDVETIVARVPSERQVALFSATMPDAIRRVSESYLRDPLRIAVKARERGVAGIEQRFIAAPQRAKVDVLARLLDIRDDAALVFARTRAGCSDLADALNARGYKAAALHGDMSQAQREEVVRYLRSGRVELVVATDVAARGLDVDGIGMVVNYDPPMDAETYLHRIGRTGRAGRAGLAVMLVTRRERFLPRQYERFTGQPMKEMMTPSNADVARVRAERFSREVARVAADEDLSAYRRIVEQMVAEGEDGLDPITLAAAVARLATKDKPLVPVGPELDIEAPRPRRERPRRDSFDDRRDSFDGRRDSFDDRGGDRPRSRREQRAGERLFVSMGARGRLRPGDLVGALANAAGIPGKAIGAIDIREGSTVFDVAPEFVERVLRQSGRIVLRGQRVRLAVARPERRDFASSRRS